MLFVTAAVICGCDQSEQISTYTVPRHETLQSEEFLAAAAQRKPQPARMLAAIVPQGQALWFFKLQGPPDDVAVHVDQFHEFLKSLRPTSGAKIEWTLPEKWRETPGNESRFATLVISDEPPLEVSVTILGAGGGDLTSQLLNNINRWRGQLDLPHIEADDLPSRTETIRTDELTVTLIDIVGKASTKPAMPGVMPPMGTARPTARKPTANAERPVVEPSDPAGPKYDKPAEWTQVPVKTFQIARFTVGEGDKSAEVALSRAGGDRAANINRWRGQLGLNPLSTDELQQIGQPFEVGSKQGELIEIVAEDRAILGVMIPDGTQTWFVKLTGHAAVAEQERARFEAFTKSLKLD